MRKQQAYPKQDARARFTLLQPFERSELRMKTAMGNSTHDAKKLLSLSVSPASRATATAYAIHGNRRVRIQDATMEAVLLRLQELCPGGTFRELWEGKTC